ncbi:hypothetical protein E0Z10_g1238 [Xylaria hypoxylon]|uniref:Uncharacterized protein n=1 Tax=Xylaria hypoxylon TaxID=37992 RepID=A0A4Z0ZD84_9PEZI|nr:hypothetical protein E0Z10_g1238 [Xylaria hypoxylon]
MQLSRQPNKNVQEPTSTNGRGTGKPDVVSLNNFASRICSLRLLENRDRNYGNADPSNTAAGSELEQITDNTKKETLYQAEDEPVGQEYCSAKPTVKSLKSEPDEFIAPVVREPSGVERPPLATTEDSVNLVERDEDRAVRRNSKREVMFGSMKELMSSATSPDEDTVRCPKPDAQSVSDVEVGEGSSTKTSTFDRQTQSSFPEQFCLGQTSDSASWCSGIPFKGRESIRSTRWKPDHVHIPRTGWERLRNITLAGPTTLKIEDVEFSAASKERLRNFSEIMASTKGQIELFGKELPLCRASLVQIRERKAMPATYICIQGLKNAADITRIHAAMSHERYKQLYSPLKLCYETSDLVYVTFPEIKSSQPSQPPVSRPGTSSSPNDLNTIPEPPEASAFTRPVELESHTMGFYQYLPMLDGKTYCGALCRTSVDGRYFVSTLGGLIEVNGRTYLMTCHHGFRESHTETSSLLSDTLVGSEFCSPSEGPPVFCSGDLPDGPEGVDHPEGSKTESRLATLEVSNTPKWYNLSIGGAIKMGPEWVLIPTEDGSILPNIFEKLSTKKGKSVSEPEIHYIDDIAEPHPGHISYIVTSSQMGCSGVVSANTSFMMGGGMQGMLEVWTVNLDEGQGK